MVASTHVYFRSRIMLCLIDEKQNDTCFFGNEVVEAYVYRSSLNFTLLGSQVETKKNNIYTAVMSVFNFLNAAAEVISWKYESTI